MQGGNLISEGGYGCIYHPYLDCKLKQDNTTTGKKYISKIERLNSSAKNEIAVSNVIKTIPKYKNFFAPIIKHCNISNLEPLKNDTSSKCTIFDKRNPSKKYILLKILYVGKQTFFKYMIDATNTKEVLLNILSTFTYLLMGVNQLYKKDIIHYDIKGENIIYNVQKNTPFMIDFGLSVLLNEVNAKTLSKCFYVFAPDYYIWCPEIHYLSYIANVNATPTNNEIKEIADEIVENNIGLHYVCSPQFIKKYKGLLINYLQSFKDMKPMDVFRKMRKTSNTWDNFSISIMYLRILHYLNPDGFTDNHFIIFFCKLLLQNIHPNATKRLTPSQTILLFNNYSYRKDFSKTGDYISLFTTLQTNQKRVISMITMDEKNLNSVLDNSKF